MSEPLRLVPAQTRLELTGPIGLRIRRARRYRDLSQEQLSESAETLALAQGDSGRGYSVRTIGNWESGATPPSTRELVVLAQVLRIKVEQFVVGLDATDSGPDDEPGIDLRYAPRDSNPEPVDCQIMPLTRRGTHPTPHAEPVAA